MSEETDVLKQTEKHTQSAGTRLEPEKGKGGTNGHDGKGTIKVRLEDESALSSVLKSKRKLRKKKAADIRAIWIQQARSDERRTLDIKRDMLLRELKVKGKYNVSSVGKLVMRRKPEAQGNSALIGGQKTPW